MKTKIKFTTPLCISGLGTLTITVAALESILSSPHSPPRRYTYPCAFDLPIHLRAYHWHCLSPQCYFAASTPSCSY